MNLYKKIGEFRYYTHCRLCFSANVEVVIDLGYMPLAGGFLKSKELFNFEHFFPLQLYFCKDCFLIQTNAVIDSDTLFKDYFYFSSAIKTLQVHFEQFAEELKTEYQGDAQKFVVEIGCNDGSFLNSLHRRKFRVLGVDPAKNVVRALISEGYPIINDYFTEVLAKKIVNSDGKADIIVSTNVLAHIEDMHDVVKGIKALLKEDGFLSFEVHYLGNLLSENQYDMIYHEHQYYYSILALKNFFGHYNMEIFEVKKIPIHAGSIRVYLQNKVTGTRSISRNVDAILEEERKQGLDKIQIYRQYSQQIEKTRKDLMSMLTDFKKKKKIIWGYGASGRGTVISNYCQLDNMFLSYVVDDALAKQGSYTPGTHVEILNSDLLHSRDRPDYIVVFAWSFIEEIKKRHTHYLETGGKFIIPLPQVKIIDK